MGKIIGKEGKKFKLGKWIEYLYNLLNHPYTRQSVVMFMRDLGVQDEL